VSIVKMQGLSPAEQEVESRAIQLLKDRSSELIIQYREKFGFLVSADCARELFPDYALNLDTKLKYALAVQKSASAIAEMVFDQLLGENPGKPVLFTAGGTGAGKTSSIRRNSDTNNQYLGAGIIFDGNFNSWSSSKRRVEKCLQNGCKVVIIFVHRHPVESFLQGVITRAQFEGRTVAIEPHLRMHKDSISTFLKTSRSFKDNENVSCEVLINTGHELETYKADIDYLKTVKYDSEELRKILQEELYNAKSQGQISQALYEASGGS
jgi:hypothetical protein